MNRPALERLVEVLQDVAEKERPWDFGTWVRATDEKCGTTACAFGWFAVLGNWPGLSFDKNDNSVEYRPPGRSVVLEATDAAERVFELGDEAVYYIFVPGKDVWLGKYSGQVKPVDVMARVIRLLELNDEKAFCDEIDADILKYRNSVRVARSVITHEA